MKYEDIAKVNAEIKTIGIERFDKEQNKKVIKQYAEVAQRVTAFRKLEPNGDIKTKMISFENGVCIFEAVVFDGDGKELATGHAYEKESNGSINKTSCIENCETSAVGRALAFCGFGSADNIASAEEMRKVTEPVNTLAAELVSEAEGLGIDLKRVAIYFKKAVNELTNEELLNAIEQKKTARRNV